MLSGRVRINTVMRVATLSFSVLCFIVALSVDFLILNGFHGLSAFYITVGDKVVGISWAFILEILAIISLSVFIATFKKYLFAVLFSVALISGLLIELLVQLVMIA